MIADPRWAVLVGEAIARLAVARGGQADDRAAEVYLEELTDLDGELIARACRELAREPRREYETLIPSVGTIRELVAQIRRQDIQQRAVLSLPPRQDQTTYRCYFCQDDPSGFVLLWCPDVLCGAWQNREHRPHEFMARCPCWLRLHGEAIRNGVENPLKKADKRPTPPEYAMVLELERNEYAPLRYLASHGRPDTFVLRQRYLDAMKAAGEPERVA